VSRDRAERGSAAVELTILTPLLILFLLLVVAAGRTGQARNDVYGAASQAARAASLRASPAAATADAHTTAGRALDGRGRSCEGLAVIVDTAGLRPGGSVTVEVACTVSLADLVGLGVPGSRVVRASASEVVDVHRGVDQ
jgi:Flp pilus assembly protein TadG